MWQVNQVSIGMVVSVGEKWWENYISYGMLFFESTLTEVNTDVFSSSNRFLLHLLKSLPLLIPFLPKTQRRS
jgi:hypothetical protein